MLDDGGKSSVGLFGVQRPPRQILFVVQKTPRRERFLEIRDDFPRAIDIPCFKNPLDFTDGISGHHAGDVALIFQPSRKVTIHRRAVGVLLAVQVRLHLGSPIPQPPVERAG